MITYQCIECNAIVKIEFNANGLSVNRIFYDEKSITKKDEANYLWGGKHHVCPLLLHNTQDGFDKLVNEGKIRKID